jgi:PAS domain S-box-containing protein
MLIKRDKKPIDPPSKFMLLVDACSRWWRRMAPDPGLLGRNPLQFWRERILAAILSIGVVLGLFVYVASVGLAIDKQLWPMVVLSTLGYFLTVSILLTRRLAYRIRAVATVLLCYALGLSVILHFGFFSGGPIWLFGFAVMAALLLGLRAAIAAIFTNAFSLLLTGWLVFNGYLPGTPELPVMVERALVYFVNFILLNAMVALSASVMVRGLQATAEKERSAYAVLSGERQALISAKESLKRENEMRRETERSLRIIEFAMNHSSDAVYRVRPDARFSWVNQTACRSLGYTWEELLQMGIADIDPTFQPDKWPAAWSKLKRDGSIILESLQRTATGRLFPVEISMNYLEYLGEEYCFAYLRDITERKQAEKALKKSEAKYRLLAENINDVIWTMDLDLNITYISPAIERMQGWSVEEGTSMRLEELLPPASHAKVGEILANQLALGAETGDYHRSTVFDLEVYCKDGALIWTEVKASFEVDADGKPVGIIGVSRDISERKRAQKEKEALQEKLERSRKMEALGLLAGGVAHDLNNVLSGIVSYPDLLLMDLPEDSALRRPILTMRESGQKAATIVQDLLTLARRGVVTTEVVNLNDIVGEYLLSPEYDKLRSYHPDVAVETRLQSDLPNIRGSSVHLKKSIMNLVSNAAEAQPEGGRIIIATETSRLQMPPKGYDLPAEGEYVLLQVEDFGQGISAEDLPRIFEPFYTKKVMGRSGTGLGMAVVWGTVEDHHGYIDVHSTPGRGSTFRLYFPVTGELASPKKGSVDLEVYMGNRESILVVDDVQDQREIAARLLSRLNYTVETVASGEDALTALRQRPADLVLLDMIMEPGIDGLETFRRMRSVKPGQKAIIASGYSETDRVVEAQRLGAGAYIRKPYTIEKIGAAIKRELRR